MNLKRELLESLQKIGFQNMTEVQEKTLPILLSGKDLIVRSKTGSGKTGAFLVPILQMIEPRGHPAAIIIVPTRELALQVNAVARQLAHHGRIRTTVVYGGASINVQTQSLRAGTEIVIGTPGRIIDLAERGALSLNRIKYLVLDEADLMLDMGFIEDIERIIAMLPRERQTMLFSATMPREITDIARHHMRADTVKLTIGEEEDLTVKTITHNYFIANGRAKFQALLAYIDKMQPNKCIIFTSTQRESEYVHRFLNTNGFDVIVMHGGLTQSMRERSLRAFKEHAKFLISTNLASRGLDIPDITDIINFDAPDDPKIYVHRVGRSARMGKNGRAFTLFGHDQEELMYATAKVANVRLNHIELDTEKFKDVSIPMQSGRRPRFREANRGDEQRPRGGFRKSWSSGPRGHSSHGGGGHGQRRHDYGSSRKD